MLMWQKVERKIRLLLGSVSNDDDNENVKKAIGLD